jgi:uncharacterized protein
MHGHDDSQYCNFSANETFQAIVTSGTSRRTFLKGGLGVAAASLFGGSLAGCGSGNDSPANLVSKFNSIAVSSADSVVVPQGYSANVLYAWGDPVSSGPVFKQDASNTAAEQLVQSGMHHDGMHFFSLPLGATSSDRGLLAINHEYTDDGLLHADGMATWTQEKVNKSQAAHGVSVIEVGLQNGVWEVVRPSTFGRRITAATPMKLTGPAAGTPIMRTALEPTGLQVNGTLNNCAHGYTPWGTFLTCEENWNGYFVNASGAIPPEQARYGISATGAGYRWHEFDARFDAAVNPNEPNRFGWVVEIDPYDPAAQPIKRTTLGRFKHEGATVTLNSANKVVAYLGDDERFEYIYKFISSGTYSATSREANRDLLDSGVLYVAKFNADGTGAWLPLVHGQNGLDAAAGFADQAEVLIKTRQAADKLGATKMDRPEWIAVHPTTKEVYATLTNNSQRGGTGRAPTDAANPRASNVFGHIIRWREAGNDPVGLTFAWDIFVQCGDPANADASKKGNIKGDIFGSPDGLWFDQNGLLWIQTDISTSVIGTGDYINIGNNQMLVADTATAEIRRFLTGPKGCEVTGVTTTPDMRTMFVNIQHPGETPSERADPANTKVISAWPDGPSGGRPRSGTVVIRKTDGGVIGT